MFGFIARLSQWGGGGAFATRRGGGGVSTLWRTHMCSMYIVQYELYKTETPTKDLLQRWKKLFDTLLVCHLPAARQEVYLGTIQSFQDAFYGVHHRLNTELDLQNIFGLNFHSCTHCLRPRNPTPRIWAHTRGRYWSAKIDYISLWPPGVLYLVHAVVNAWMTDNVGSLPVGSVKNLCQDSSVCLQENEWRK